MCLHAISSTHYVLFKHSALLYLLLMVNSLANDRLYYSFHSVLLFFFFSFPQILRIVRLYLFCFFFLCFPLLISIRFATENKMIVLFFSGSIFYICLYIPVCVYLRGWKEFYRMYKA